MFSANLIFECYEDSTLDRVMSAIQNYIESLRNSGQVIGREIPVNQEGAIFTAHVMCPEEDALSPLYDSPIVQFAKKQLNESGILQPKVQLIGRDLLSDQSDRCQTFSGFILFTNYISTCSPIRCYDHFEPVPLYKLPAIANGDQKQIIKWQEDYVACDQLQMNGALNIQHAAIHELSSIQSDLFRRGTDLCKRLQYLTKVPVYYYLYRIGGESKKGEEERCCPKCQGEWKQPEPLHGIFDFICETCRIVSNLSWDHQ